MSTKLQRAALLGLGEAGSEIARDLLAAGVQVRAYDPDPARWVSGVTAATDEADAMNADVLHVDPQGGDATNADAAGRDGSMGDPSAAESTDEPKASEGPAPRVKKMPGGPRKGYRYRFGFEKVGPVALLGHLDLVRELPRILRRCDISMEYTQGFHPKPDMVFAPALSLGVMSVDEFVEIRLAAHYDEARLEELTREMTALSPKGLRFKSAVRLDKIDPPLSKVVSGATYVIVFARKTLEDLAGGKTAEAWLEGRIREILATESIRLRRSVGDPKRGQMSKMVDVRSFIERLELATEVGREVTQRAGISGDIVAVEADLTILGSGAVKSSELAEVVAGSAVPHQAIRSALWAGSADARISPRVAHRAEAVEPSTEVLAELANARSTAAQTELPSDSP